MVSGISSGAQLETWEIVGKALPSLLVSQGLSTATFGRRNKVEGIRRPRCQLQQSALT